MGKVIVLEGAHGEFSGIGQMIGYCDFNTAIIRFPDGTMGHWHAGLTREATPTETAIVQTLAPAQNECFHDKNVCGRLTKTLVLCGRCKKAVEE